MTNSINTSILLQPLSDAVESAFNKMGSMQVAMFNARVSQLADKPKEPATLPRGAAGKNNLARSILHKEAEKSAAAGLLMLRRNNGQDRFEGNLVVEKVEVRETVDHMPVVVIDDIGEFRFEAFTRDTALEMLKKISTYQLKSVTNITTKDANTVTSDGEFLFELYRAPDRAGAFRLRVNKL